MPVGLYGSVKANLSSAQGEVQPENPTPRPGDIKSAHVGSTEEERINQAGEQQQRQPSS